jgi:hypothetical protein
MNDTERLFVRLQLCSFNVTHCRLPFDMQSYAIVQRMNHIFTDDTFCSDHAVMELPVGCEFTRLRESQFCVNPHTDT